MKKLSVAVLACLGGIALSGSAFAANETPQISNSGVHNVEASLPSTQIKPLPCSDFDPQTGGLKGWTPQMGIGPAIPAAMIPKDCPAIIAWKKAHPIKPINPDYNPQTGLKGWKPSMGVGPALTPEGHFYPEYLMHKEGIQTQLPASAQHLPPNPTITHTVALKPYKCSDFNPKTGGLKGWNPAWGIGPVIPAQLLPKNCPALEHHIAPMPATAPHQTHFRYKCSDFNPKTGALKNWNPAWGIGPAIPASELPLNCPALAQHKIAAKPQQQSNAEIVLGGVTYKCSDLNPKTGTWKGWTPEMGTGPAVPPQLAQLCKIITA